MFNLVIFYLFVAYFVPIYKNLIFEADLVSYILSLSGAEMLEEMYRHGCTVLVSFGMYRGAFKKFLSHKVVYFILLNMYAQVGLWIFNLMTLVPLNWEYRMLYLKLLVSWILGAALATKVILAARENPARENPARENLTRENLTRENLIRKGWDSKPGVVDLTGTPDLINMVETKRKI